MSEGRVQYKIHPIFLDEFGVVETFATHLSLSLANMSPEQAFEAAQHATRHYLKSYEFNPITSKGSDSVLWNMAPKASGGDGV